MEVIEHNYQDGIKVTVLCNVFNHGKYIKSALDGFAMQNTNFPFEVIVHDDASTDDSASIIKEYALKYPNIITAILQTENQHSKGISIGDTFTYPMAKGKYFAICEGDDYWTDPYKLQCQYDALEAHSDVDICAHGAIVIDAVSGRELSNICARDYEGVIPVEDVITGGGGFFATNSLMFRKEVVTITPPFRENYKIDYTLQINGALNGGAYYLPQVMSVYRKNVPGSWTMRTKARRSALAEDKLKTVNMLECLDAYTNYKYTSTITNVLMKTRFDYYRYLDRERELFGAEYKNIRKSLSGKEKVAFYLKACFPWLIKVRQMNK